MFILKEHIVVGIDFANNFVIHRDNAGFQASAELEVQFTILEKQHVSGITSDIHDKDTRRVDDQATLRNDRCICLRKHHNLINYNTKGLLFIDEIDCASLFEVVGKLVFKYTVVFRRQTYCQLNLLERCISACGFQFFCDCDECQNKISLIVGFVLHIV